MNKATGTMVEQTLVDVLLWYRAEVKDIRDKHTGSPLSEAQLCKNVRDAFTDVRKLSVFFRMHTPTTGCVGRYSRYVRFIPHLACINVVALCHTA